MEEKSDNENNCRRPLHSELSSDCASGRLQHTDLSKAKASISQYSRSKSGNIATSDAQILNENGDP